MVPRCARPLRLKGQAKQTAKSGFAVARPIAGLAFRNSFSFSKRLRASEGDQILHLEDCYTVRMEAETRRYVEEHGERLGLELIVD